MSPMYAACTAKMLKPHSDLVFIEFVQNDLYRSNGAHALVLCAWRHPGAAGFCCCDMITAAVCKFQSSLTPAVPAARDMAAEPRRKAFERVLRNALAFPTHPAVVVFTVFPHEQDFWKSAENDMLVIAQHYQVPVISTRCTALPWHCM
jgi:hypothetical protein